MIGLQWRPGKEQRKPRPPVVVISSGPSTPDVERQKPPYDPMAAAFPHFYQAPQPVKRGRGRPKKVK